MKIKSLTLFANEINDFFKNKQTFIFNKKEYEIFVSPNPITISSKDLALGIIAYNHKNKKATHEIYFSLDMLLKKSLSEIKELFIVKLKLQVILEKKIRIRVSNIFRKKLN